MIAALACIGLCILCLIGLLMVPFFPNHSPNGDLHELGKAIRKLIQTIKESIRDH